MTETTLKLNVNVMNESVFNGSFQYNLILIHRRVLSEWMLLMYRSVSPIPNYHLVIQSSLTMPLQETEKVLNIIPDSQLMPEYLGGQSQR